MDTPRHSSGRKSPARKRTIVPRLARTAVLCSLGSFALAGAAFAAPCADGDCGDGSASLDGLAMAAQDLHLRSADLGDAQAASGAAAPDSVAPLLFLTPRVASILEDVFGDTQAADAVIDEAEPDAAAASDAAPEDDPKLYGPLSQAGNTEQAGNAEHLPKLQRQMYRTDI